MSGSNSEFQHITGTRLYAMPSGEGTGNVGWCAYLLPGSFTGRPDSIAIENAFGYDSKPSFSGHFLFALKPPENPSAFVSKVTGYIKSKFEDNYMRAFLWFPTSAFDGGPVRPTCGFGFGVPQDGAPKSPQILTRKNVTTLVDDLPLRVEGDLRKNHGPLLSADGEGIVIDKAGPTAGPPVLFESTGGIPVPGIMTGKKARIPLVGPYSGCFLLTGAFTWEALFGGFQQGFRYVHGTGSPGQDAAQVYPVIDPEADASCGYIAAVDPLDPLNRSKSTVDLKAGRLRTLFALTTPKAGESGIPSFLRTTMNRAVSLVPKPGGTTTQNGPADRAGALILEREGSEPSPSGDTGATSEKESAYFTLAGDFSLALDPFPPVSVDHEDLLCGLFGTESVRLNRAAGSGAFGALRFTPQCDAYVPIFPLPKSELIRPEKGATEPRLNGTYKTSRVSIMNDDGSLARYLIQTQGNSLYAVPQSEAQDELAILDAYTPWRELPATALPMAAYAGLRDVPGELNSEKPGLLLGGFESQILSAERKRIITGQTMESLREATAARREAGVVEDETDTTTPSGLLVTVSASVGGTVYDQVTLAQFRDDDGFGQMAFFEPDAELQQLFQTNQLFGVVVNPKHLGDRNVEVPLAPSFDDRVTIAGWKMSAAVGEGVSASDYRNVMIFKFCNGKLADRVKNPRQWTQAKDFSVPKGASADELDFALTGLSKWLQEFIKRATDEADGKTQTESDPHVPKKEDTGNPLYKNFARIVRDPAWQGILVLRAHADPTGIPEQIRGLAAGIDASQFEAHHFGATVSRVKVDEATKSITIDGQSSLFGLIDYQYPAFRQNVASGGNPDIPLGIPVDGDYGFTVLQLQALFENAALVDFVSRVQLTANNLFGSKVVRTVDSNGVLPGNGVVLRGAYEHHGSTSTYVFKQVHRTSFEVDSSAFNAIAFDKVLFNTLSPGSASTPIRSRFLIWGAFDFATLKVSLGEDEESEKPIDVLSFGSPDDDATKLGDGLAYSNLQIDLSSPFVTPTAITFTFDPARLALDFGASVFRAESLFSEFALQVDSFIASTGDKRPSGYGYLPVRVTDYPSSPSTDEDPQGVGLKQKALSGPWFGIVYKVTMGTPGALASKAGFESKMLIAWTPEVSDDPLTYPVFSGLQLPGAAPGAKLISLQGILKVSLDAVELFQQERPDHTRAFCLKLANIGLKFLGFLKLPPGATINFFLFGDPTGKGSLGWYAVYKKDKASNEELIALDDPENAEAIPAGAGREETAP
ncbi:MAG: hypothetical protein WBC63_06670 [Candidatus Bipolaricaulia bacterium]